MNPDEMGLDEFDRALDQLIDACANGEHQLTEPESRIIAAAWGWEPALTEWGHGHGAPTEALINETEWLIDSAAIIRDPGDNHANRPGAQNLFAALHDYFTTLATTTTPPDSSEPR